TAMIALGLLTAGVVLAVGEVRVRAETDAKLGAERQRADEEKGRADAEKARADAETDRARALEKWRQTAYYFRICKAFNEYLAAKVQRADQMLEEQPPDLRHWEWNYLKRLCHGELTSITVGPGLGGRGTVFSPGAGRVVGLIDRLNAAIYDIKTGKEVSRFAGKNHWMNEVAFSADGKRLATCGMDRGNAPADIGTGAVRVWGAATGQELAVLEGIKGFLGEMSGAAWSPDGQFIAAADQRGHLFIWDVNTRRERFPHIAAHTVANAKPNESWSTKVAFSPDGKQVATAC